LRKRRPVKGATVYRDYKVIIREDECQGLSSEFSATSGS
jgi:hypothetical protein